MPGGANCFRRALLEMALDRGAATESLLMGFTMKDEHLAGHAWLSGAEEAGSYQFTVHV
jgi:hypothetical protein